MQFTEIIKHLKKKQISKILKHLKTTIISIRLGEMNAFQRISIFIELPTIEFITNILKVSIV